MVAHDAVAARKRLLAGVALTERRLEVGGLATRVLEVGTGPPLVLLHGGIECGGVYWAPVINGLAGHYRVVVPDVPGLGESAPFHLFGPVPFAGWFTALLRLMEVDQPTLVAHSLLGTVAAQFADRRPGVIGRLVIYGAPGVGAYRMPLGLRVAATLFGLAPSQRSLDRFTRWAFRDPEHLRRRDPGWYAAFRAYLVSRARVPHVQRTMRQLVRAGTRQLPTADLRRIEVPTALLWGRHDRMVPLRIAESASRTLDWPRYVVDTAGHVPHIEAPQAFLSAFRVAVGDPRRRRVQ